MHVSVFIYFTKSCVYDKETEIQMKLQKNSRLIVIHKLPRILSLTYGLNFSLGHTRLSTNNFSNCYKRMKKHSLHYT